MKVKELKKYVACMNDEEEININLPLSVFITFGDLTKKRIFLKNNFPEEGIPLLDVLDGEEEVKDLMKECIGKKENLSSAIINTLYDWDKLQCFIDELINFEIR